jgi:signal transduction histidine kinase
VRKSILKKFAVLLIGAFACTLSAGEVSEAAKALAAESEVQCTATAKVKPTPQMIKEKIDKGCALIEKEGSKAFSKFKGAKSEFLFAGTYIWINDMNGVMLMHPIKPGMENSELIGLKDSNGKRFFVEMIDVCKKQGAGWVDYMWPKPGEKDRSLKVSYVKKAMCDGKPVMLGCGVYDMTLEEIKKTESK